MKKITNCTSPPIRTTGRKRAEVSRYSQQRRRREHQRADEIRARLAAIVQSSEDAIFSKTLEGIITSWNPSAERMYGYTPDEIIGQSVTILIPPEHLNDFPFVMDRIRRGVPVSHYDTVRMRKNGARVDVSISVSPIHDARGQVIGAATIARNITERKQAEDKLRFLAEASKALASSLEYQATLENLVDLLVPQLADYCAVHVIAEDGEIQLAGARHATPEKQAIWLEYLRHHLPRLQGNTPASQVLRTGQATWMAEVSDAALADSTDDDDDLRLVQTLRARSLVIVPLLARGQTLGVISMVYTESDRQYGPQDVVLAEEVARRAAQALDNGRLYQEAQEAIRLRDQFLSIASHELKTPLTSIKGYTQVLGLQLQQSQLGSERIERALKIIDRQTDRLTGLINDLLDVSRIETGRFELRLQPTDLLDIIRETVGQTQILSDKHPIHVHTQESGLIIQADQERLQQVLANLLENAIKYSPSGGAVDVKVSREAGRVMVSVTDQGIGIPRDQMSLLFQRFYRARNVSSRNFSGLGLGLYISREIIERHGGRIWVESQEGQGSTFAFELPAPGRR